MIKFRGFLKFGAKDGYIVLFFILLLGFGLRLYKIDNPVADWHSWRQADTASVAKIYLREGIDLVRPRYHDISSIQTGYENTPGWRFVEFPIFNATHALFARIFPMVSFEVAGRLVAVISSLLSAIFIFLIGKRFMGTTGGLLAALFFLILPFNVYFSRVILPEPMAVMLGLSSLWLFVFWIDKDRLWQILVSAILFSLAILVKPFVVFYAVPMLYLAWEKFRVQILVNTRLWIFLSLSLILFFLWRGWMNQYLEGIPFWAWAFNGDNIRFRPSFWWWIFEERLGRLILGVFLVTPFIFGFLYQVKDKYRWFLYSLFGGQVAYWSLVATANVRHDYYQTLSVPAVALILAAGVLAILRLRGFNKLLLVALVFGSILLGIAFSAYQVKEFYKINHPEIILAGQAVQKLTPKDALVIAPYNGDTAFLYQTDRQGWPIATLPMDKMVNRLGAQYYVSVNFDKQTQEVIERYTVLEKAEKYVVVKLDPK